MIYLNANSEAYQQAITTLKNDGLVILPTETVYGLAALASSDTAVRKIYEVKGRNFTKPLSIGVWSTKQYNQIATQNRLSQALVKKFWPGPLTLISPLKPNAPISPLCHQGGSTIGVRHPKTQWTRAFRTMEFWEPIVLTSANQSGAPEPITAQDAKFQFGDGVDLIIDNGPCSIGKASTVMAMKGQRAILLREGGLSPEHLAPYGLDFPI